MVARQGFRATAIHKSNIRISLRNGHDSACGQWWTTSRDPPASLAGFSSSLLGAVPVILCAALLLPVTHASLLTLLSVSMSHKENTATASTTKPEHSNYDSQALGNLFWDHPQLSYYSWPNLCPTVQVDHRRITMEGFRTLSILVSPNYCAFKRLLLLHRNRPHSLLACRHKCCPYRSRRTRPLLLNL